MGRVEHPEFFRMGATNGTRANLQAHAQLFRQVRGDNRSDLFAGVGGLRADGARRAAICREVTNGADTGRKIAESAVANSTATGGAIDDGTVDGRHE